MLKVKDEEEETARNDLKAQAAKVLNRCNMELNIFLNFVQELEDWYTQNDVVLENLRATNRESMSSREKLFVAEMEPVEQGF